MRKRMDAGMWTAADLELLMLVESAGSLTAAARKLAVSQSTLSRRLAELEERIGEELFARTREGLVSTAVTRAVLPHAATVLEAVARARSTTARDARSIRGRVRLSVPEVIADLALSPRVVELLDDNPELELDLVATDAVEDVERLQADLVVRFAKPTGPDIKVRRLASSPYARYVGRGARSGSSSEATTVAWLSGVGRLRTNRIQTKIALATACPGRVALVLPTYFGDQLSGLRRIDEAAAPPGRFEMFLAAHAAVRRIPAVDAVWSWVVSCLR